MDDLHEQESESFVDDLKKHNPFKLCFVRSDDVKMMESVQKKIEIFIDTPTQRYSQYINTHFKFTNSIIWGHL